MAMAGVNVRFGAAGTVPSRNQLSNLLIFLSHGVISSEAPLCPPRGPCLFRFQNILSWCAAQITPTISEIIASAIIAGPSIPQRRVIPCYGFDRPPRHLSLACGLPASPVRHYLSLDVWPVRQASKAASACSRSSALLNLRRGCFEGSATSGILPLTSSTPCRRIRRRCCISDQFVRPLMTPIDRRPSLDTERS